MLEKVKGQDLYITRGDDEAFLVRFKQSIAGSTFFFTAKRNKSDSDANAVLSITASASSGLEALLTLPSTATAALSERSYFYDIQWKSATGAIKTILMGKLIVDGDVTTRTT